jgi:hypothetical protein
MTRKKTQRTKCSTHPQCSYHECDRKAGTQKLCDTHYRQKHRKGVLTPITTWGGPRQRPVKERLLDKCLVRGKRYEDASQHERKHACWVWTGSEKSGHTKFKGRDYGQIWHNGRIRGSHRVAYELFVGPIGNDTVHHKCANRRCCNPNHLQRATQQENKAEMFARNGFEAEIRRLTRENRDLRKSLTRLQNMHVHKPTTRGSRNA